MFPLPKRVFLTRGVGIHRQQLAAFEYALRDADIEQQNLVTVSSILPPQCDLIPRQVGVAALSPGEITFCVMARSETNEAGRLIASGIGLARPKHSGHYGYISEHHGYGMTEAEIGEYVEDLAASMLASTLGIEFNPDAAWNERKRALTPHRENTKPDNSKGHTPITTRSSRWCSRAASSLTPTDGYLTCSTKWANRCIPTR